MTAQINDDSTNEQRLSEMTVKKQMAFVRDGNAAATAFAGMTSIISV